LGQPDLAGVLIDKFRYHLPLYRQHQRMDAAGIHLARSTLTGLVHRTADLLQPIYAAQLASALKSRVLTMDETPIKAGRRGHGGMKTAYFWPVYGDKDEVVFPFSPSRAGAMVREVLGEYCGVLISDGYQAYERYAEQAHKVIHAQCWSHTRRQFVKAEAVEPELTARALTVIRRLYDEEAELKRKSLDDTKQIEQCAKRCKPIVDDFFEWIGQTIDERLLLPSNPFTIGDVPPPRRRSLHLPRRRVAACRRSPLRGSCETDAAAVERALRRQSAPIRHRSVRPERRCLTGYEATS